MNSSMTQREKWQLLLSGHDVGPLVSPLCDSWRLDTGYYWPYKEPEPFPEGHRAHILCEQMAMAEVCGWDLNYLCAVDFIPTNPDILPQCHSYENHGCIRTETVIRTPFGDLTGIEEKQKSMHVVKQYLNTREDYHKAIWLTKQQLEYQEDVAIGQGLEMRKAVGDRGMLGTWQDSPYINYENHADSFYHIADWPDEYEELFDVSCRLKMKRLETYRKAGFDYLFYCVSGTEFSSPDFFRKWTLEDTKKVFKKWREMGGFILWHTCGHVKKLIEEGFYNELKPDIFETLSEPPVGNLPGLRWARERIDENIITRGNIPLNILLEGTEEEVRESVQRVREETRGFRHIIGLSDDVLPNTPLANCLALADESRKSG